MDLHTPSSPGGLPTLSLTTNCSWLPWGMVAVPLISPLMLVPQFRILSETGEQIQIQAKIGGILYDHGDKLGL